MPLVLVVSRSPLSDCLQMHCGLLLGSSLKKSSAFSSIKKEKMLSVTEGIIYSRICSLQTVLMCQGWLWFTDSEDMDFSSPQ